MSSSKKKSSGAGSTKRSYKRRCSWNETTEKLLISIWQDRFDDLRRQRKNNHIYKEMAKELTEKSGIQYTDNDVSIKIHNLSGRYSAEKKKGTGSSPSSWRLYAILSEFLGSILLNNLDTVVSQSFEMLNQDDAVQHANQDLVLNDNQENIQDALQNLEHARIVTDEDVEELMQIEDERTSIARTPDRESASSNRRILEPSSSSSLSKRRKIRLEAIQEAILDEIKESNAIMREEMKKANEISQQSLELDRDRNSFLKDFLNSSNQLATKILEHITNK